MTIACPGFPIPAVMDYRHMPALTAPAAEGRIPLTGDAWANAESV